MGMVPPQPVPPPGLVPGYGQQIQPGSAWQAYMTPTMDQGLLNEATTFNDAQANANEDSQATNAVTNYTAANGTQAQIAGAMLSAEKQSNEFANDVAQEIVSTTKNWLSLANSA